MAPIIETFFDNCALHRHDVHRDEDGRGCLAALEVGRDIPFPVARIYYVYGMEPGAERGFHAHKALDQWAVCVSGACTMLLDNGRERRTVRLDSPDLGLHLGPMIWHEMRDFSSDCVLMVMADAPFDVADYIRDHGDFLAAAAPRPL